VKHEQVTNVVVTGVGGQGVLKAADILALAALEAGYDVKSSVARGMSRRGGGLTGDVRFGSRVLSPMVPNGEVDYIVVLEATQTGAARVRAREDATFIHAADIDCGALSSPRSLNVAALGRLSTLLSIPESAWTSAIRKCFAPDLQEDNIRAFNLGRARLSLPENC
jgi:indolepyruvate ferredoxin oxidoreductase, beta subunit